MAKTLYEGYRVGKNGGERWTGTIRRSAATGKFVAENPAKTPKGGSVIRITPSKTTRKEK